MTETKNKTKNTVREEQGYNVCPTCGRRAYALYADDGHYYVGCVYCGLKSGACIHASEMTEDTAENLRQSWNKMTLNRFWDYEGRESIGIGTGGYVIATNADGCIVHSADSMQEVIEYLEYVGDDISYGIYLHIDGTLQYLGCTYLVWLIQQALNDKKTKQ